MAALIQYARGVPAIKFPLDESNTYIGRDSASDICLANEFVSKQHALIEMCESKDTDGNQEFYIYDLGSTNRTYVNGKPINSEPLKNRDMIRIGEEEFVFEQDDKDNSMTDLKPFSDLEKVTESNDKFSRRIRFV